MRSFHATWKCCGSRVTKSKKYESTALKLYLHFQSWPQMSFGWHQDFLCSLQVLCLPLLFQKYKCQYKWLMKSTSHKRHTYHLQTWNTTALCIYVHINNENIVAPPTFLIIERVSIIYHREKGGMYKQSVKDKSNEIYFIHNHIPCCLVNASSCAPFTVGQKVFMPKCNF